jgi:hypothetical protein
LKATKDGNKVLERMIVMSYCVNCGVELAKSEKYCPLCNVEVVNPKSPWQEPAATPYPKYFYSFMKRIDHRYFATLAGLFLIIPILVTIIYDLISGDGISWSAYVAGAMALLYIFIVLPFYFKRYHTVIFLSVNCAAVLLYLFFIERMNGGSWFKGIGMPITIAASVCIIVLALLFTKKKRIGFFIKTALVFIASGIFLLSIELILSLNNFGIFVLNWSFYAFVPCALLGFMAFILEHRKNLKEEIRRRLFY